MAASRTALTVLLVLCGCRETAFLKAAKANTTTSYRHFLAENPGDENAATARERLAELEFVQAQKVHSVVAYKRFLEEFPDSDQSFAATALLETLRYNVAVQRATGEAYRQYLLENGQGHHRADIEARLAQLEPQHEQALLDADRTRFEAATSAEALFSYLDTFPAGAHRDHARTKLLSSEIDGLLVSGSLDEAQRRASRNPLSVTIADLPKRFTRATQYQQLIRGKDEAVAQALPGHMLRPFEEVVAALHASDPLDRWQAAEELGFFVSVHAIDPLIESFQSARLPLIRQRAFEALERLISALPPHVAEYEITVRLRAFKTRPEPLTSAMLRELSNQRGDFEPPLDPFGLRRIIVRRLGSGQFFSAAVAARQLSNLARGIGNDVLERSDASPLPAARELCSALELAKFATEVIERASHETTEFPEDIAMFKQQSRDDLSLLGAQLRDREFELSTREKSARPCTNNAVMERMAEGEARRIRAVKKLRGTPIFEFLFEHEPSPQVRAQLKP